MRLLLLLIVLVLFNCSDTSSSGSGGASEIIVVVENDSIRGDISGIKTALEVQLYSSDFLPSEFSSKQFISQSVQVGKADSLFLFTGLNGGLYNLLIQDMETNEFFYLSSLEVGGKNSTSYSGECEEPLSVSGTVNVKSTLDTAYILLCLGTPFKAEVDTTGAFAFSSLPKGGYSMAVVEKPTFVDGPDPEIIPVVDSKSKNENIEISDSSAAITVHLKRSME